ncbi:MAG: heme biosynthesis protein [Desulfobacterales bacterium S3730MH5]|nr:MAG: heme biosynthesis protein [Desulfobacterales bacterium S3730MH5]
MNIEKTVAFQKNSRNIFFHILTQCNLKCRHCYINPKQHGNQTLPVETVTKWLKALWHEEKTSNLIFIGGEPTLHQDLDLCIRAARKIGYGSITVDTNGFLFNNIVEKVTPGELDYFSFGLDGSCKEINDLIRGKGSYDKCVAGIEKALLKGFDVSVIYTVSQLNINDLQEMPGFLRGLGIKRFFIQVIGIRGRSAQNEDHGLQITKKEWGSVVPLVAAQAARLGIHVTYPKVFLDNSEPFECAALVAENYFIFPNGRVYQCPLCEDFPLHSYAFKKNKLTPSPPVNEKDLFQLSIPEGCVMNKLIQPGNLCYDKQGRPEYKIACCLLKQDIKP